MKKYLIFFIVVYACHSEKNNKIINFTECKFLQLIPDTSFTPLNHNWVIYFNNKRFQIKEIEKYKLDTSIDSFFIIKSDGVLTYSYDDLRNDTLLFNSSGSRSKRTPIINRNILIDKNDTFLIKSFDEYNYFVQSDSIHYRLYTIKR